MSRNLALSNSFFLQFTNNSSTDTTLNLFNLGGANQTSISNQQTLSQKFNLDLTNVLGLGSALLTNTLVQLIDSTGVFATANLLAGQDVYTALPLAVNPVTDNSGNTGYMAISPVVINNPKFANVAVGNAQCIQIKFLQTAPPFNASSGLLTQSTATFITTNPLVVIGGTIPYGEILQSETGNAYRILSVDVFCTNSNQLFESVSYGRKDVNGDKFFYDSEAIIDPYQLNSVSLLNMDTGGFVIDSETLFAYTILAQTSARVTFNYVRASVADLQGFEQAFIQKMFTEYYKSAKILQYDNERFIKIQQQ